MKKQSFLRLFAVLLVILMLLPTLAACGGETDTTAAPDNNNTNTPGGQKPGDEQPPLDKGQYVILGEKGVSEFSVVYSETAVNLTKAETVLLKEYFTEVSDAVMEVVTDSSVYSNKEVHVGVVGSMGRPELEEFAAQYELGLDDYVIKMEGEDLILACGSKEASVAAIAFLKKRLLYIDEDEKIVAVPADLHYVMRYDAKADRKGLQKVEVGEMAEDAFYFTVNPHSENDVPLRLTYNGEGGWRLQSKFNMARGFETLGAAQLLATTLGETIVEPLEKLSYYQDGDNIIAQAPDKSFVVLNTKKFSIKFCDSEGNLVRILNEVNHAIKGKTNTLHLTINFSLDDTEMIFGTGERFDSINQRGKTVTVQSGDVSDNLENSYVAIPLFVSSKGSGVFINNNGYMLADIGVKDYNELAVTMTSGNIDCYVYVTNQIADVIDNYSAVSGYAAPPANWTTGLLVSRYNAEVDTYASVVELIKKTEAHSISWTGIVIDGWDISDFEKHEELKKVCDYVHSLGKKVICNVSVGYMPNPETLPEAFALSEEELDGFMLGWTFEYYYTEIRSNGYFNSDLKTTTTQNIPLLSKAGDMIEIPIFVNAPVTTKNPATCNPFVTKIETGEKSDPSDDVLYATRTYIDITNPVAVEWFFGTYWNYLVNEIGVDGAKIDGANTLPDAAGELNFYDSTIPGGGARNWYSTYFAALIFDEIAKKEDSGVCFTRGGGIGSQRNGYIWGGEQSRTVNRLERQIKGLISAGLSGLPFVTYDIGGSFYKNDDVLDIEKEAPIFLRAAQFAMFTSAMQIVDGEVRGPFDFEEEDPEYAYVTELYRLYVRLHTALSPYIDEYSAEACETGMPLARHLILAYQNDKNVYGIEDEYLFGDAFLVAPELYGKSSREVYLPEGTWKNLFTGETYVVGAEGQTILCEDITMAQIPVYYKMDNTSETAGEILPVIEALIADINNVVIP